MESDLVDEKLPHGWSKSFSKSQKRYYYFNAETHTSVWSINDIQVPKEELEKRAPILNNAKSDIISNIQKEEKPNASTQSIVANPSILPMMSLSSPMAISSPVPANRSINVAILVPFRDLHPAQNRQKHLQKFVPYMEKYLSEIPTIKKFQIFIIEQSDDGRKFNRGKLLNCAFKIANSFASNLNSSNPNFKPEVDNDMNKLMDDTKNRFEFDSFIFHDVDLIPVGVEIAKYYGQYPESPVHIARCWDRYNDDAKYFGGVVAFNKRDFELIDGFPNTFWGWGGEDNELHFRCKHYGLRITGPPNDLKSAICDMEEMTLKQKLDTLREHREWKCQDKWEALDECKKYRDMETKVNVFGQGNIKPPWWGLSNIFFIELDKVQLGSNSTKVTIDIGENINEEGSIHVLERKY